ncbi:glutamine synthetase family protein [Aliiglaciecola sp. CAU 1673]|uniref:glutamine synthetase family protein n=1 Tax=Aliiglaciecola sp. CAU 1673 TaxID=3032595 RepID=UPI0023DC9DD4|nr:glutamine synthetase family protein [Aliiglaciecola sp. CAU 1673]MDF2177060.1 glutamine synthetase family protein [Aliiglaciecola sp. CAU 1673]
MSLASFLEQYPNIEMFDLIQFDLNGVARGKRIKPDSIEGVLEHGMNIPFSVLALDASGETVESSELGLQIGEPDRVCKADLNTLAICPWQSQPTAQLLFSMYDYEGKPVMVDPRNQVKRAVELFHSMGLRPVVALELEFYLLDKKRTKKYAIQPPISPRTGKREESTQCHSMLNLDDFAAFLQDVDDYCNMQGVPADTAVSEYAPGQFEINLTHHDDPLLACDHAVMLKRIIRQVADKHDMQATFMAKPYSTRSGSGLHIHVSVLDEKGNNVFGEGDPKENPLLRQVVAGLLATMQEATALLCPNINSYRRLQPNLYVPMYVNWGIDNRTVAVRIPNSQPHARRIEHRVAGADANPYVALATVLFAMYQGIRDKMTPPDPQDGNTFQVKNPRLPNRLPDALAQLRGSKTFKQLFGEEFIKVYTACKEQELLKFEQTVTQKEYDFYLNRL